MEGSHWLEILEPTYRGRRFIIATDVLAGVGRTLEFLRRLGAATPFVIAAARGIGQVPAPDEAEVAMIDVAGGTTMTWLRNVERAMQRLPDGVIDRIDAWDPDGEARVLGPFLFGSGTVARRPLYGARPDRFVALEDKMIVDDLWDRALVLRVPSRIHPVDDPELGRTAAELDWGAGTVWVADNKTGWHGGAELLRWVASPELAGPALDYLRAHADRVRVMPFIEGIPCSIHGIVVGDDVVVARPVEMLTLRRPAVGLMKYVGTATFYDPPGGMREDMRHTARAVGSLLRSETGYTGAFTIDGVASAHGFVPTELNPRLGAGLFRAVRGIEDFWLLGVHRALLAGEDLDYRPRELERLLVSAADQERNGVAFVMVDEVPAEPQTIDLGFDDAGVPYPVDDGDGAVAVEWGFGTEAGALSVRFDPAQTPVGPAVAGRAAAALAYAARHWPIDLPDYVPASDVHRPSMGSDR